MLLLLLLIAAVGKIPHFLLENLGMIICLMGCLEDCGLAVRGPYHLSDMKNHPETEMRNHPGVCSQAQPRSWHPVPAYEGSCAHQWLQKFV